VNCREGLLALCHSGLSDYAQGVLPAINQPSHRATALQWKSSSANATILRHGSHHPIDLSSNSIIAAMVKSKFLLTNLLSTRGKLVFEPRSLVAVAPKLSVCQLRPPRRNRRPRHALTAGLRHPTPCAGHAHALRVAGDHVLAASGRQAIFTGPFFRVLGGLS